MASSYFIKGKVIGRKDEVWHEFSEVFNGVDNAKVAFDNYVAAIRTKRDRIPQDIEIDVFNRI